MRRWPKWVASKRRSPPKSARSSSTPRTRAAAGCRRSSTPTPGPTPRTVEAVGAAHRAVAGYIVTLEMMMGRERGRPESASGAGGGNRTPTGLLPTNFESVASTVPPLRREVGRGGWRARSIVQDRSPRVSTGAADREGARAARFPARGLQMRRVWSAPRDLPGPSSGSRSPLKHRGSAVPLVENVPGEPGREGDLPPIWHPWRGRMPHFARKSRLSLCGGLTSDPIWCIVASDKSMSFSRLRRFFTSRSQGVQDRWHSRSVRRSCIRTTA